MMVALAQGRGVETGRGIEEGHKDRGAMCKRRQQGAWKEATKQHSDGEQKIEWIAIVQAAKKDSGDRHAREREYAVK